MKKNLKKLSALLLALALSVSTTACGNSTASTTTAAETAAEVTTEAASESAAETSAAAGDEMTVTYPVTITDHLGREVTIEKQPESFVSGYYISTSLLIALGLDDQLVGVEAKADKRNIYKLSAPELTELPSVGTAKEFDLEGCAALKPDLVIVPTKLKDSIPAMEELGLTVIAVNPEDQTKLFETIDMISTAADVVEKGHEHGVLAAGDAHGDAVALLNQVVVLDGINEWAPQLFAVLFNDAALGFLVRFKNTFFAHVFPSVRW